jgi:curved DNA-binding protein CbpA
VKTHYELLSLEISADADAIKKAFRREIARYHPDKVIHLGAEFQEMAATRAAELTIAYKTLSDPGLRAEYDAGLAAGVPPPHVPPPPTSREEPAAKAAAAPPVEDINTPPPPTGNKARFASERADRDLILRRAIAARVQTTVEALYGKLETPTVRGFDLAMVPVAKPRFMGAPPPRVLVKVLDTADAAAITESWVGASRARIHSGKSPVIVLMFARHIASQRELSRAHDSVTRGRKAPGAPEEIVVIVVDVADWSCRLPPGCSAAVKKLAEQICA